MVYDENAFLNPAVPVGSLKRINASLAAIISAMGPIVTLSLDVVVLNHNLTLNEIIGAIIVTACVTCLTSLNAKA